MAYAGEQARHYAVRKTREGTAYAPLAAWEPLRIDLDDIQFTLWWLGLLPAAGVTGRGNGETVQALIALAERKNLRPGRDFVRASGVSGRIDDVSIDSRLSPLLGKEMQRIEALPQGELEELRRKLTEARLREGGSGASIGPAPNVPGSFVTPQTMLPGARGGVQRWYHREVLGIPMPIALGGVALALAAIAALAFRRRVVPNGRITWHRIDEDGQVEGIIAGETVAYVLPTAQGYCATVRYPRAGIETGALGTCFGTMGAAKEWAEREVRAAQREHARYGGGD